MRLSLDEITKATGGRLVRPASPRRGPVMITGVSTDTRTLQTGDLFVALRGPRADGHAFIADALRRGAAAALASHVVYDLPQGAVLIQVSDGLHALARLATYYRRTLRVRVIGVTGSVGKTATVGMCTAVLATRFAVVRTKDDWNAEIGVPLAILALTPQHSVAVIEMAMRGLGQIAELVALAQPELGVVTTIGESHLELLGTLDNVARAKGELIAGLPAHGTAVLNADDPRVMSLARLAKGRVISYGLSDAAQVRGTEAAFTSTGMRFRLQWQGQHADVVLSAWGQHSVSNALAASAVGLAMGLDVQIVAEGLARYTVPKMRLQPVSAGPVLVLNDAYNASPASMEAAFEVLASVGRGRRTVAVLGEMKELGPDSARMHREVGASLARHRISVLVTIESGGEEIASGAADSGMPADAIIRLASVDDAVARVRRLIRAGDVVLVKGSRAVEMERIVTALQHDTTLQH